MVDLNSEPKLHGEFKKAYEDHMRLLNTCEMLRAAGDHLVRCLNSYINSNDSKTVLATIRALQEWELVSKDAVEEMKR